MWTTAVVLVMTMVAGAGLRLEARAPRGQEARASAAPAPVINLNAATTADLEKLPGVGAAMAARILEYRQKSGGFKKIEELMNVKGIGVKSFLKLKPLVTVAPAKVADR
jgi:competence protein ComEA